MQSAQLIQSLEKQTHEIIAEVEALQNMELSKLTWKANKNSWSVLECLEHLNLYGDFYLPQIESSIKDSNTPSVPNFKSGMLGNYFAKSMLPKEKLNKMKTFKDKNPLNADLDKKVIDRFLKQQKLLLDLLNQAKMVNLNKVKVKTSISSLIRLKLGDTFRFFVNHEIRHLAQINRVLEMVKSA